jgi:hypothetical protein
MTGTLATLSASTPTTERKLNTLNSHIKFATSHHLLVVFPFLKLRMNQIDQKVQIQCVFVFL